MAYSYNDFGAKSPGDTITVSFPFRNRDEVFVTVGGNDVSVSLYSWVNDGLIEVLSGFPSGAGRVERRTSVAGYESEQSGSSVYDWRGANANFDQNLLIIQEYVDGEAERTQIVEEIAANYPVILAAKDTALQKASEAAASATAALTSENTASTKASEAAASAASALASKSTAETKAGEAASSAASADTSKNMATTKASEAAASAAAALASENTATTKASEAAASAASALVSKNTAETKATESAASASSASAAVSALTPLGRLAPLRSPTTDANSATDAGWYYSGVGARLNWPDNTKYWVMGVISSDLGNYLTQYAYRSHAGSIVESYTRKRDSGTWHPWTPVLETKAAVVSAVREVSPYVDLLEFGSSLGPTDDWRGAFNAAVAKVASVSPVTGAPIRLPAKQIYLSYVDRIVANGITFVGGGKKQIQNPNQGDVIVQPSSQPAFAWGTVATEATGGGLRDISLEASRTTNTSVHLIDLINSKGAQFENLWVREPMNAAIVRGGVDVRFQNATIGGVRGSGIKAAGYFEDATYGTLRGDRLHLYDVTVGGHGANNVADNTGPGISVEGYWHSVYGARIDLIQINEGLKVDSPYSDAAYMPQFIALDGLSIDFALNRSISFIKGEHLWLTRAYISSALNGDLILFDVGAADMQIKGGKLGFPKFRIATLLGKGFLCEGVDIHAWSQDGSSSSPAFYAGTTANNVRLIGNEAGRTGKLGSSTSGGERLLEVQSGASCYGCVVGNNMVGLHGTYILNSGTGNVTDVGNSARP